MLPSISIFLKTPLKQKLEELTLEKSIKELRDLAWSVIVVAHPFIERGREQAGSIGHHLSAHIDGKECLKQCAATITVPQDK